MKESDELLDVLARLKSVECLAKFTAPENFPPCQQYRLPLLMAMLLGEIELLKDEMAAWLELEAAE